MFWLGAVIGAALGATLTAFLTWHREWSRRQQTVYMGMLLLKNELRECQRQLRALADPEVLSPLYRLPVRAFERYFPEAVMVGRFSDKEIRAVHDYYYFVDQVN